MRKPVYDPGPQLTATASKGMAWLSVNDMASSTIVPKRSAPAPRSPSSFCSNMHCPFSDTATEQTLVLVSIFNIQAITFLPSHFKLGYKGSVK
jgi:hypothetical protein